MSWTVNRKKRKTNKDLALIYEKSGIVKNVQISTMAAFKRKITATFKSSQNRISIPNIQWAFILELCFWYTYGTGNLVRRHIFKGFIFFLFSDINRLEHVVLHQILSKIKQYHHYYENPCLQAGLHLIWHTCKQNLIQWWRWFSNFVKICWKTKCSNSLTSENNYFLKFLGPLFVSGCITLVFSVVFIGKSNL